jgi:predicted RNA-binding protein with PIN domain
MHLIVDAFNVLHCWGGGPEPGGFAELESLSGLIARSRFGSGKVSLVCDGARFRDRPARLAPPCKLLFAGPGKEADPLIESLITRDSGPRELIVASSDRRLQRAAGRRGSRWISSRQFLSQIIRDSAAPERPSDRPAFARRTPLRSDAVEQWLAEFDIAPDFAGPRAEPPPIPDPEEANRRAKTPAPPAAPPERQDAPPAPSTDPLLREALEHWRGRLSPGDLDMQRWLDEPSSKD